MIRPGRIIRLRYNLFGKVTSIEVAENQATSIQATNGGTFLIEYKGTNLVPYFLEVAPKEYELELSAVEYENPREIAMSNKQSDIKTEVVNENHESNV